MDGFHFDDNAAPQLIAATQHLTLRLGSALKGTQGYQASSLTAIVQTARQRQTISAIRLLHSHIIEPLPATVSHLAFPSAPPICRLCP